MNERLPTTGLILWTFLPCLAIWSGLYLIKSAAWAYALYHFLCLVPAIIWGRSLWLPTLVRPKVKDCLLLLGTSMLFSTAAVVLYEFAGAKVLSNQHVPVLLKELGINRDLYFVFAFYGTVINPILEELFWRGVVLNALDRVGSRFQYFAITLSSLLYALFHYLIFRLVLYPGYAELGILLLAGFGALMAVLYRRTGSILTTAFAHGILTDLACVVLLFDYARKFGGL